MHDDEDDGTPIYELKQAITNYKSEDFEGAGYHMGAFVAKVLTGIYTRY